MTRLVGQVASGVGDLAQWMRTYREAYRDATGVELVPGSLNIVLDRRYRLPQHGAVRLGPDQVGVGLTLVPCFIEGRHAFLFRTDRNEAGVGRHARHVLEIVAEFDLRDELGLEDGDRVEVVVPGTP